MIEILPGVFVTPAKAIEIHASLGRVISSHLAPTPPITGPSSVLADVLAVWPAGEPKASSARLAELLARSWGERYASWLGADVSRALRGCGVSKRQVWVNGTNLQGFLRADLELARAVA